LIGRAVRLGYGQSVSVALTKALLEFIAERKLSAISWAEVTAVLESPPSSTDDGEADRCAGWVFVPLIGA
jgi:hypothetical protein